jgi:hypothetical protein
VDQLAHYGWHLYDVARIVQWCGHPLEFVTWPEGDGWCRLLPVLGDAA